MTPQERATWSEALARTFSRLGQAPLFAGIADLLDDVERMLACLRDLRQAGQYEDCPWCYACVHRGCEPHAQGCELAAILREIGGDDEPEWVYDTAATADGGGSNV